MDWDKIKTEYITTNISYRELAEKYGVSFSSMTKMASKQKWNEKRKQNRKKIETKTLEKISDAQSDQQADMINTFRSGLNTLLNKWADKIRSVDNIKDLRAMAQTAVDLKGLIGNNEQQAENLLSDLLDNFVDGEH